MGTHHGAFLNSFRGSFMAGGWEAAKWGFNLGTRIVNNARNAAAVKKHNEAVAFARANRDQYLNHLIALAKEKQFTRLPEWAKLKLWVHFGPQDKILPESKIKAEAINLPNRVENYLYQEHIAGRPVKRP